MNQETIIWLLLRLDYSPEWRMCGQKKILVMAANANSQLANCNIPLQETCIITFLNRNKDSHVVTV